ETDTIAALQHGLLSLHLRAAIERNRPQRSFFRTELAWLADPVAAIRHGHHNSLLATSKPDQRYDRLAVNRLGSGLVAVAHGRTDKRCERNYEIGITQERLQDLGVPRVTAVDIEIGVGADVVQGCLPKQEIIQHSYAMPFV